jgi:hypothetical protein
MGVDPHAGWTIRLRVSAHSQGRCGDGRNWRADLGGGLALFGVILMLLGVAHWRLTGILRRLYGPSKARRGLPLAPLVRNGEFRHSRLFLIPTRRRRLGR